MITGGEWKGYKGRVVGAHEKTVTVEVSSKYRHIPIDRKHI
jgi:transcription elongation factor